MKITSQHISTASRNEIENIIENFRSELEHIFVWKIIDEKFRKYASSNTEQLEKKLIVFYFLQRIQHYSSYFVVRLHGAIRTEFIPESEFIADVIVIVMFVWTRKSNETISNIAITVYCMRMQYTHLLFIFKCINEIMCDGNIHTCSYVDSLFAFRFSHFAFNFLLYDIFI